MALGPALIVGLSFSISEFLIMILIFSFSLLTPPLLDLPTIPPPLPPSHDLRNPQPISTPPTSVLISPPSIVHASVAASAAAAAAS